MGLESASTVVYALCARSAVGLESASTVVERSRCKECGGGICEGRYCKEICGTERASICEHGRRRSDCKECGGASICGGGQSASTVVRRSSVQGVRWV